MRFVQNLVGTLLLAGCASGAAPSAASDGSVAAYRPCAGKTCGEPCSLCPPGEADCREPVGSKACDPAGSCRAVPFLCEQPSPEPYADPESGWVPCAGKRCGEPCSLCPPNGAECVETQVPKACSADGRCVPAPAICAEEAPPGYQ